MDKAEEDDLLEEIIRLRLERDAAEQKLKELEAFVGDLQDQIIDLTDAKSLRGWINPIYAELD